MKKKNIIGISVALGVLVGIVLIVTMVFTLNTINFQLTTTFQEASASRLFVGGATAESVEAKMLEDAEFNKGGNLLFMNFAENIDNIEHKNPYVKVEKIVRSFPNKITVYYSEREPVALVQVKNNTNGYFVIDEDLKVLDAVEHSQTNYVLPVLDDYEDSYEASVGSFIDNSALKSKVKVMVASAYTGYNVESALYKDVLANCTKIEYYTVGSFDKRVKLTLTTSNNHTITIEVFRVEENQAKKLKFLWRTYFTELISRYESYTEDQTAEVYENNQGKIVLAVTAGDSANPDPWIDN